MIKQRIIDRYLNQEELLSYIIENKDINYVVTVVTPYTFICARAVLRYIMETNHLIRLKGIVMVFPWQPDKWAINSELPLNDKWATCYNPIWVKYKDLDNKKVINRFREIRLASENVPDESRRVFVVHVDGVWDWFAVHGKAKSNISFEHYYLDEPREPYYNTTEWMSMMKNRMSYFATYVRHAIRTSVVRRFILKQSKITLLVLPVFDRKKFFHDNYVKYMSEVFLEEVGTYDITVPRWYVIYLSNVYREEDKVAVNSVAYKILKYYKELGCEIFIKKHPRESDILFFHDLDTKVIPNHYSIEAFVASVEIKPIAVIGATTTALTKISRFWNIDCYCMLDDKELKNKRDLIWVLPYMRCAMRGIEHLKYSKEIKMN